MRIDAKGPIVPDEYREYYDFFEQDCICPAAINEALENAEPDEEIEIYINSPGGVIDAGSEIYTALRKEAARVKIYVTGQACSAASVVAMAAYCEMAPTALMMVHCVSTIVSGNHNDMEKTAAMLATADKAMCRAYVDKSGMSEEDALDMMNRETWLTAEQAVKKGLVDAVMFENKQPQAMAASSELFTLPTPEQMARVQAAAKQKELNDNAAAIAAQHNKIKRLRMRG